MNHLQIAILQIGVSEDPKGSNSGPVINKYLESVGLNPGYSWCMAFIYWCCKESNPNTQLVKTAGVLSQWNEIPPEYKFDSPLPGDIFIMDFGGGHGHTGFVEDVQGDIIHTIEGNSNEDGSREGYEVCRKPGGRHLSSIKGFIRVL